jgi:hypothetical protein
MFAQLDKDLMLEGVPSPRIVLVGGSNLSFGLNSELIEDSLHLFPIDTGISAGLGLKYMLANIIRYIRVNDIIIVSAEYHQFYDNFGNGDLDLLSMVVDVPQGSLKLLDYKQILKLSRYLPQYTTSKLLGYFNNHVQNGENIGIYERKSFNDHGDAFIHWKLPNEKHSAYKIQGKFNKDILNSLIKFRNIVNNKKAKLFITFPCFEKSSFESGKTKIMEVENKLKENDFNLISRPEEYEMNDSLIFESAYHLNKKGVDYRTKLLIHDLRTCGQLAKQFK